MNKQNGTHRASRMSFAFVLYLIAMGLCYLGIELGMIPSKSSLLDLIPETIVLAVSSAFIYYLIKSGYSQRFSDPDLVFVQIVISIGWISYAIYLIQIGRGVMLSSYMLVIFYGAFRLNAQEFFLTVFTAIVGFLGIVIWEYFSPPPNYSFNLNIFYFSTLCVFLSVFTFLASYMRKLKEGLRASKQALEQSHEEVASQRDEIKSAYTEMQETLKHLGEIASRDELTGLFNRRQFVEVFNGHISVAKATGEPFGLALLDIDHFKKINDSFGHAAGDRVLEQFSLIAQDKLRDSDFIARYGGEEFVILISSPKHDSAFECIERVRQAFESFTFNHIKHGLKITVSAGISHFNLEESGEDLINRVDKALYEAKASGRNRSVYIKSEPNMAMSKARQYVLDNVRTNNISNDNLSKNVSNDASTNVVKVSKSQNEPPHEQPEAVA